MGVSCLINISYKLDILDNLEEANLENLLKLIKDTLFEFDSLMSLGLWLFGNLYYKKDTNNSINSIPLKKIKEYENVITDYVLDMFNELLNNNTNQTHNVSKVKNEEEFRQCLFAITSICSNMSLLNNDSNRVSHYTYYYLK